MPTMHRALLLGHGHVAGVRHAHGLNAGHARGAQRDLDVGRELGPAGADAEGHAQVLVGEAHEANLGVRREVARQREVQRQLNLVEGTQRHLQVVVRDGARVEAPVTDARVRPGLRDDLRAHAQQQRRAAQPVQQQGLPDARVGDDEVHLDDVHGHGAAHGAGDHTREVPVATRHELQRERGAAGGPVRVDRHAAGAQHRAVAQRAVHVRVAEEALGPRERVLARAELAQERQPGLARVHAPVVPPWEHARPGVGPVVRLPRHGLEALRR
mmetsp:Transcript_18824/g.57192  ORF Transcript_18824/g.57192 Transcript_18824/m.57192 type:complete len:270 (+) Transcript_18824:806-1615(+)